MAGTVPFVGRVDELRALHQWLDDARDGQLTGVSLQGEAGVGKTQLLTHFVAEVVERHPDVAVLRGACHEGLQVPYLPLTTALRTVGDLGGVLEPLRGDDTPEHADARMLQLYIGATDILDRALRKNPVALIIDDLHWADKGTLDLLGHLVQSIGHAGDHNARLLVALAHRPVTNSEPAGRFMERLQREPWHRRLAIAGLDSFSLHDLVERFTGHAPSRQLLDALESASAGNPMLVRALLERLDLGGALVVRGDQLHHRGGEELLAGPRELDALLRYRLSAVSQRCREMLTLAAFLGEDEPLADVRALSGMDDERFEAALDEAIEADILIDHDRVAFDHGQLRQVLYQGPRGPRRQNLHLRVAAHLESLEPLSARAIAIAHHLRRAGPAADPERVVRWCLLAANEASSVVEFAEAARCYEAAIEATREHHGGEGPSGFLGLLHSRAAYAHWYNFDNPRALEHALAAIAISREIGDFELWAASLERAARATWSGEGGAWGNALDEKPFHEFLDAVGDRVPHLRAHVHELLAVVELQAIDVASALDNLASARALFDVANDDVRYRVEFTTGSIGLAQGEPSEALESLIRSRDVARDSGAELDRLRALRGMAMAHWVMGDLHEAAALAEEACLGTPQMHAWAECAYVHAVAAGVAVAQGRLDDAEQAGATAERLLRWARFPPAAQLLYCVLACGRTLRRDYGAAQTALDQWAEIGQRGIGRFRSLITVLSGAPREAVPPSRRRSVDSPVMFDVAALGTAVEIGDAIDDLDQIAWASPALEQLCRQGVMFDIGWCFFLPRLSAVAAARLGRVADAKVWFDIAQRGADRAGATLERSRVEADRARLLS